MNELNKWFATIQCLRVTTLDDVVLMECGKETALFFIFSTNVLIATKMLCSTPDSSISLLLCHENKLARTWNHFLLKQLTHTNLSRLSICTMLINMLHLFEHDPPDRP